MTEPTPAAPAAPETPATPETPAAPEAPADSGFKFEGEFDKERAEKLVTNLKNESKTYKQELAEAKAKLAEHERAKMSETEKLQADYKSATDELAALKREMQLQSVAKKHNLPEELTQFITGDTAEEMDAKAKLLADKLQPATPADVPGKPRLKPTPGNGADTAVAQLSQADLDGMSPAEIDKARRDGRLDSLLRK